MGDVDGNIGAWGLARGGMGAISNAIAGALQQYGGEIRTSAGVKNLLVKNGKASGVVLENGDELQAHIVVSNLDAKRTFTKIVDRKDLPPGIYEKAKNFKIRGSSGKVNIALSAMPKFNGVPDNRYIRPWWAGVHRFTGNNGTGLRLLETWSLVRRPLCRIGDTVSLGSDRRTTRKTLDVEFCPVLSAQAGRWTLDSQRNVTCSGSRLLIKSNATARASKI